MQFEFALKRAASNKGGDRYECVDQRDFTLYLPQRASRAGGEPAKRVLVTVVEIPEAPPEVPEVPEMEGSAEGSAEWAEGKRDEELVTWIEWPVGQYGNAYGFASTHRPADMPEGWDLPRCKRPRVLLQEVDYQTGSRTGMYFYRDEDSGKILYVDKNPGGGAELFEWAGNVMRHRRVPEAGFKFLRLMELTVLARRVQECRDVASYINSC